jgi:flagellar protein FlaG
MSSETIVNALFLITAVVAASVLITAIFPTIYRTTETFGSVSHEADVQMRTDIKIVNTFSNENEVLIWLKNIGSTRISKNELIESDIFLGDGNNIIRLALMDSYLPEENELIEQNQFWDPGETLSLEIQAASYPALDFTRENIVYFQIVLPNGVKRNVDFDYNSTS